VTIITVGVLNYTIGPMKLLGFGDTGADIAEHVVSLVEDGLLRQQPTEMSGAGRASPFDGCSNPAITRSRVDFPAPLGPTPILAPGRNDRVASSRITLSPHTTRARFS